MRSKVVTLEEALTKFEDGQTIMFGDWHGELSAEEIITGMLEKGVKDIDAIAVSGGMPDQGLGRLISEHRIKSLATTHIGLNPVARDQMFAGELEVEFIPQGTFAERIRCGGAGLGACITPTGLGTDVEIGKEKITINGKEYLVELPMRADVALIKAWKADTIGNIAFRLTGRATNSYMALAADTVIVEVEELVEVGELGPDDIDVPAPIIDMVYVRTGEKKPICPMWKRAKAKAEAKAKEKAEAEAKAKEEAEAVAKAAEEVKEENVEAEEVKTEEETETAEEAPVVEEAKVEEEAEGGKE